jgi:hypothetical protein
MYNLQSQKSNNIVNSMLVVDYACITETLTKC